MAPKKWKNSFKRDFEEIAAKTKEKSTEQLIGICEPERAVSASEAVGSGNAENTTSAAEQNSGAEASSSSQGIKFRKVVGNMFLSNRLSALESHDLAAAATEAGAVGSQDLAKCGTSGKHPQNMHRDLLRALLKDVEWPSEYFADVPVLDPDTLEESIVSMPFSLPHEAVKHMVDKHGDKVLSLFQAKSDTPLHRLMQEQCQKLNISQNECIALGLHGDGTPFAAKMRDSLEQFSYNFPASDSLMRCVFGAVPKRFVASGTFEAMLRIFVWSMTILASGFMPTCRHDGTEWQGSDKTRKGKSQCRAKLAGLAIGVRGILCQIRGDWMFYKQVFHFPSWSENAICWLCQATRKMNSEFDMRTNKWQSARFKPGQFVALLLAAGLLSCIFQCPGIEIKHFLVDWLHCADLGICQSIIGNAFNEIVDLLEGSTRKDRVCSLWKRIKHWYKLHDPPSKLEGLTPEMIRQPSKGAKLRAKAGETRYLIPFCAELAREFDDGSVHRNTVRFLCESLQNIATIISTEPYNSVEASVNCQRLRKLYVALEAMSIAKGDDLSWRVKPKLHLFEELICYIGPEFGSPRFFWTYRDEHWGHWLATTATRRGGPKFAASCALNLLLKFKAIVTVDL